MRRRFDKVELLKLWNIVAILSLVFATLGGLLAWGKKSDGVDLSINRLRGLEGVR